MNHHHQKTNLVRMSRVPLSILMLASLSLGSLLSLKSAWAQKDETKQSVVQNELKLKDGTTIKGEILEQTAQEIKIKTLLGTLSIPVANIVKPRIRVKLNDGSIVQGLLLGQTDQSIQVISMMGQLSIDRANIEQFQLDFKAGSSSELAAGNSNPNEVSVVDLETGRRYTSADSAQFENSIEPLIDMFFDPTAYVFNEGDIYISGLSLAYGLTSSSLISVNLINLVGLNQAEKVNPNIELKWQPYFKRNNRHEHGMALGIKAQSYNFNGFTNYLYNANGQSRGQENIRHHEGYIHARDICDDDSTMISSAQGRAYGCSVPNYGWQSQLYIAQSVSWLMQKGGRFSLHAGANIELNSLNYDDWIGLPSYRAYAGMDLDLSPSFKILGEVFYDPNFQNIITNDKGLGVDFGIVWALTKNFRLLIHTQPYILGLYWRF